MTTDNSALWLAVCATVFVAYGAVKAVAVKTGREIHLPMMLTARTRTGESAYVAMYFVMAFVCVVFAFAAR